MLRLRPFLEPPAMICEDELSLYACESLNVPEDTIFRKQGSRFFAASNADLIGPALLGIISEQRRCVLFKQLCLARRLIPTYEDIQTIDTTQMATDYQLLHLPFTTNGSNLTPMQDAVRLAVYIFAQAIMTVANQFSAFSRSMSTQLKGVHRAQ